MTLTDLAALASILSSVAVLISLVYLSLQARQAERNQQASIRQGRATRAVDIILAAGEAGAIAAMPRGAAGAPDLAALEFGRFAAIYGAFLASAVDSFFRHREGCSATRCSRASPRAGASRSRSRASARSGRCAAAGSSRRLPRRAGRRGRGPGRSVRRVARPGRARDRKALRRTRASRGA